MSRKSKSHRPSIQAQMDTYQKSIDYLTAQHEEMKAHLSASRRDTRSMAYSHMLNTFLNILKFAVMDEPVVKKRRNSKRFQNNSSSTTLVRFLKTIYPDRPMDIDEVHEYFKKIDSLKDQRDRITHPRSVVELHDEALRFSSMLEDHKTKGDVLDPKESLFLDVFRKIDHLCAERIGHLCW